MLSTAAVAFGLTLGTAAQAQEIELGIGGFYKGYVAYVDQDETTANQDARSIDWLQDTEIEFTGETTLDNGLTVGFHTEANTDQDEDFDVEEAYAYFSGSWGRVNAGAENGAAYLLQVAAPSADSNVDGIRTYVQPTAYTLVPGLVGNLYNGTLDIDGAAGNAVADNGSNGSLAAGTELSFGLDGIDGGSDDVLLNTAFNTQQLFVFDYDDDVSGYANKLTYLSPVFSGLQVGVSFTPENDTETRALEGVHIDNQAGEYGSTYELAARYEGQYEEVGFVVGAGFTHSEIEQSQVISYVDEDNNDTYDNGQDQILLQSEDRQSYNVGVDLNWGPFGVGLAYLHDDLGLELDSETWVLGADYVTGPYKFGASYYGQNVEVGSVFGPTVDELETDRYTGGLVYTYGPGMTFRGSISYIDHSVPTTDDTDSTSVLLGTQINF